MYNALHFPNFTPAELKILADGESNRQQRLKKDQDWKLFNQYKEDQDEHYRRNLIKLYDILVDDFGHYVDMPEDKFMALIYETLNQAADALKSQAEGAAEYGISDDGLDYLHATSDQIAWLHDALGNDDRDEARKNLIELLNRPGTEDIFDNSMGFFYGYADHGTHISDLMRSNYEQEVND